MAFHQLNVDQTGFLVLVTNSLTEAEYIAPTHSYDSPFTDPNDLSWNIYGQSLTIRNGQLPVSFTRRCGREHGIVLGHTETGAIHRCP